jgi:hypothetical protein
MASREGAGRPFEELGWRARYSIAAARAAPRVGGITYPQDEALGAGRGGLSTKLHLRTDGAGRPLVILATVGQRHEDTQLERLLDGGAVKRTGPGRGSGPPSWPATRGTRFQAPGGCCAGVVSPRWSRPSRTSLVGPLRPGRLPRAQPRGAQRGAAQAAPQGRHPLRQARGQPPGLGHPSRHRLAMTPCRHALVAWWQSW